MKTKFLIFVISTALCLFPINEIRAQKVSKEKRPRARDLGLKIGILPTGTLNSITDVDGVLVGHRTIIRGKNVRTGVTAILPHSGNIFRKKVPASYFVGNGYGKFMGTTQIEELGEIETPILLTSTLAVPKVADFLIDYMLALPGNQGVHSINPVVAETNDGFLNDIRGRHITREDVYKAIESAGKSVGEGSVGAGTGTVAFGWKGGIGTSSRKLPDSLGGYTIGVLVQTNYGGVLQIGGAPVGVELGKYYLKRYVEQNDSGTSQKAVIDLNDSADGSVIIVVATDAPVDSRNLKRIAARTMFGLARTGAAGTNGSGDYGIAFSTARANEPAGSRSLKTVKLLSNSAMSPLFLATIEATEEAIYNSLFRATSVSGNGGRRVTAIPINKTVRILRKYRKIK